eukprot:scaffold33177_cov67-Skeletonema_dohrnii-CCMP3373.AAC.1
MSISANTAAAAAASVADGLGVVVAAAVTIVNIIPSSFYVLLRLATGDAGCWRALRSRRRIHTRTHKTTKLHAAVVEIFPFEFRRRMSLEANLERYGRLPDDVIFIVPEYYRILCEADKKNPAD